jgi:hypothetical protein
VVVFEIENKKKQALGRELIFFFHIPFWFFWPSTLQTKVLKLWYAAQATFRLVSDSCSIVTNF